MKKVFESFFAAVVILAVSGAQMSAADYLATDFGARADGLTLNTASIQAAIDFASANGGGRVVLTPGSYLCGSIYLKSDVTLHLEKGAVLLGSLNPLDYVKDPVARWTAFVFAVKQNNVGITGEGVIDGRGVDVAYNLVDLVHKGVFKDDLKLDRPNEAVRPECLHFERCTNVTIKGITLKDPASWTQQYVRCDGLLIDGVTVDAKSYWNNDGLDVVDSRNVIVRNCYIDAADDAYCFKSHGKDGVSENVLVENCVGRSSANGIKFGTFTLGEFRHFRFRNMTIFDTYRSAFTVASVDGAIIEDVEIDGLRSIHTGNPFFIRLACRRVNDLHPACLKDVVIKNVYAEVPFDKPDAGYGYEGPVEDLPRNVCPSSILGTPGMRIENVRFENVEIVYPGKADPKYAYRGSDKASLQAIPELEKSYPEFSNWKEMPAWAFYVRHADGIEFRNVTVRVAGDDYRPAFVLDDVVGAQFCGVTIDQKTAEKGKNQIVRNNVKNYKNRKK